MASLQDYDSRRHYFVLSTVYSLTSSLYIQSIVSLQRAISTPFYSIIDQTLSSQECKHD